MPVHPASPANATLLVLLPLVAWRLYARIRRLVGRQRLSRVRPWITLTVFPLLVALLAWQAVSTQPLRVAWLAGGLVLGGGLAVFGLRRTVFESTPQGLYYTPNAHLGIALSLLLAGRLAYRLVEAFLLHPAGAGTQPEDFTLSAPTLAVFGLLAGYYVGYAVGLVRWRMRVLRAKRLREGSQKH